MSSKLLLFLFSLMLLALGFQEASALSVSITSPRNGTRFERCSDIIIKAEADIPSSDIKRVLFYMDSQPPRQARREPWEYTFEQVPDGIYNISLKLSTKTNESVYSDTLQIFVGSVMDGDKIKNGEFACGTDPWNLSLNSEASATFELELYGWLSDEPTMAYIDIENPGSANWHVMLTQSCPIDSGHVYEVYFMAEVEEAKVIGVAFQGTTDDYPVHNWTSVELNRDTYKYGPFEWYCPVTDPSNEFKLAVSENSESIFLDGIKVIDKNWVKNTTHVQEQSAVVIADYELKQNYPNPFNPSTHIHFSLPQTAPVKLSIYDVQGRLIKTLVNAVTPAGSQTVTWDGTNAQGQPVPSGVYLYELRSEEFSQVQRMVLIR